MRFLFIALVVLSLTVTLTLVAQRDPGYVFISQADWSVETSFTFFLLVLAIGLGLLTLLMRWLSSTWTLPRRIARWRKQRRSASARRATNRGLIALAEGNWQQAERDLSRAAEDSDTPLLNYLAASRAAQKQGSDIRRDQYLLRAHHSMPNAALAIGLTQAEVQLSSGQSEQALATLMHLRSIAPRHEHVLYLLKRLYLKLESWDDLLSLLPDLRRYKVMPVDALNKLEHSVQTRRLACNAAKWDDAALKKFWDELPRSLRQDSAMVGAYARTLLPRDKSAEAEQLLRDSLKQHWDLKLVRLYGQLEGPDLNKQLTCAEGWLKEHERQAEVLLAAGRLALKNGLWGKARSYLEASLGSEPRAETYCELGNLLHQLGEQGKAEAYFRKGLELSVGGRCTQFTVHPSPIDNNHSAQTQPNLPVEREAKVT